MRIIWVCDDPRRSGSARVRAANLTNEFGRRGVESRLFVWTATGPPSTAVLTGSLLRLARRVDAVILQKPRLDPRIITALRAVNSNMFVDIDDAIWTSRGAAPATVSLADEERARRFRAAARASRAVVAGSEYLAGAAGRLTDRPAFVVRSSVDATQYVPAAFMPTGPPTVGWIGSAGNRSDFDSPVLDALAATVSDGTIRFVVISSEPLRVDFPTTFLPWSEATEIDALSEIDIGLMPLPDDERSRGRCSYKAIQHLALARPVIASPVGGATEVVRDGHTGMLARSETEWEAAIRRLATDTHLRSQLGEEGRRFVTCEASITTAVERWIAILADGRAQ